MASERGRAAIAVASTKRRCGWRPGGGVVAVPIVTVWSSRLPLRPGAGIESDDEVAATGATDAEAAETTERCRGDVTSGAATRSDDTIPGYGYRYIFRSDEDAARATR